MSDLRDSELRDYDNLLRDYHAVVAARDQALRELGEAREIIRSRHAMKIEPIGDIICGALSPFMKEPLHRLAYDDAASAVADEISAELAQASNMWTETVLKPMESQRDAALRSTAELRGALAVADEFIKNLEDEELANGDIIYIHDVSAAIDAALASSSTKESGCD